MIRTLILSTVTAQNVGPVSAGPAGPPATSIIILSFTQIVQLVPSSESDHTQSYNPCQRQQ